MSSTRSTRSATVAALNALDWGAEGENEKLKSKGKGKGKEQQKKSGAKKKRRTSAEMAAAAAATGGPIATAGSLRGSKRKTRSKANQSGSAATPALAPLLPALNENSSEHVLSFLDPRALSTARGINLSGRAMGSQEALWKKLWETLDLDPLRVLPSEMVESMVDKFSHRKLVSALCSHRCSECGSPTASLFVLTCSRVCDTCFTSKPSVKMSSVSLAKAQYLLSDKQVAAMPTLRVLNAKETGCVAKETAPMTLTTQGASLAAAIERFGSEEAFLKEKQDRKDKAQQRWEAKQAQHTEDLAAWKVARAAYDQRVAALQTAAGAGQEGGAPGEGGAVGGGAHTAAGARAGATGAAGAAGAGAAAGVAAPAADALPYPTAPKWPSRPRVLGLERETNFVGVNQQEYRSVSGEKYGHVEVVNDWFFEGGATKLLSDEAERLLEEEPIGLVHVPGILLYGLDSAADPGELAGRIPGGRRGRAAERALIALVEACEPGDTIVIDMQVELNVEDVEVKAGIRLRGRGPSACIRRNMVDEHIEHIQNVAGLVVRGSCIIENLRLERRISLSLHVADAVFNGDPPAEQQLQGPGLFVVGDAIFRRVHVSKNERGPGMMVQRGRVLLEKCVFSDLHGHPSLFVALELSEAEKQESLRNKLVVCNIKLVGNTFRAPESWERPPIVLCNRNDDNLTYFEQTESELRAVNEFFGQTMFM